MQGEMCVRVPVYLCYQGLVFHKVSASFVECSFSWELKGRCNLGTEKVYLINDQGICGRNYFGINRVMEIRE